jgi:hypothetical protein
LSKKWKIEKQQKERIPMTRKYIIDAFPLLGTSRATNVDVSVLV